VEFLQVKLDRKELNNANISVCVDAGFIEAVKADTTIDLVWANKTIYTIRAREIWNKIIDNSLRSGDPGLLNLDQMNRWSPYGYIGKIDSVNPCLASDVRLHTASGMQTVGELFASQQNPQVVTDMRITQDAVDVGHVGTTLRDATPVFETGKQQLIYRLITRRGHTIRCTANHRFPTTSGTKQLDQLKPGDVLLIQSGEGKWGTHGDYLAGVQEWIDRDGDRSKAIWEGSRDFVRGYLAEAFQRSASVTLNARGVHVRLSLPHDRAMGDIQLLLGNFGIPSSVNLTRARKGIHEIRLSQAESYRFSVAIGFSGDKTKYLEDMLDLIGRTKITSPVYTDRIASIVPDGKEDVYCLTQPETHSIIANGIVTMQCAEEPLLPDGSCTLGSIVLPSHITDGGKVDWNTLAETVLLGVRFLDNVLDVTHYPLRTIEEHSRAMRYIGLGVTGLHDAMLKRGIKYSSPEAIVFVDKVLRFVKEHAYEASVGLAIEKGQFALLDRQKHVATEWARKSLTPSLRHRILEHGIRNCCLLTSAPTGTTSIVCGCSSGIEPIFASVYRRRYNIQSSESHENGQEIVVHPLLAQFIKDGRDTSHFENAHSVPVEQHLKIQLACQRHVDAAVSKTINLPSTCTSEELSELLLTYIGKLKGVTVYRDGSKGESPYEALDPALASQYMAQGAIGADCKSGQCNI
jgi:ribonucleotide reductase alpha subunit